MGLWHSSESLDLEWAPKDYFMLRMKQPNQDALDAFERVLGHKALAAYRDDKGNVTVEWRVRDGQARMTELEQSGVHDIQRALELTQGPIEVTCHEQHLFDAGIAQAGQPAAWNRRNAQSSARISAAMRLITPFPQPAIRADGSFCKRHQCESCPTSP